MSARLSRSRLALVIITALVLVLVAIVIAVSDDPESNGGQQIAAVDADGRRIEPGHDWSGEGDGAAGTSADSAGPGSGSTDDDAAANRTTTSIDCGVPTTVPYTGPVIPGADLDNPFPQADNDFPITFTMSPTKGDPLTDVRMEVVAVGKPQALIVILAQFYDGDHHGMRAAKVADLTGRAVFEGPIPADAPIGTAIITASASTADEKSAVDHLRFIVTGPGCR